MFHLYSAEKKIQKLFHERLITEAFPVKFSLNSEKIFLFLENPKSRPSLAFCND